MCVCVGAVEQVCCSDLQRGHSGDGYLSSSILFKYECSMGHLFVHPSSGNGSRVKQCNFHCMLYIQYCLFGMFTILDYSSALEYIIIRHYTNIVYYYR